MTEKQLNKYGIPSSQNGNYMKHEVKEHGLTIKVMTLEEQKKAQEEKEKLLKEYEEKAKAKESEKTVPCESLDSMFDPDMAFYTSGNNVSLVIIYRTKLQY